MTPLERIVDDLERVVRKAKAELRHIDRLRARPVPQPLSELNSRLLEGAFVGSMVHVNQRELIVKALGSLVVCNIERVLVDSASRTFVDLNEVITLRFDPCEEAWPILNVRWNIADELQGSIDGVCYSVQRLKEIVDGYSVPVKKDSKIDQSDDDSGPSEILTAEDW